MQARGSTSLKPAAPALAVAIPPDGRSRWSWMDFAWTLASLCLLLAGCREARPEETSAREKELTRCATCHGDPTRPGDALLRAAPPMDLYKNTESRFPGVGAHQLHLEAGSSHAAVACNECHRVPLTTDAPGHADDAGPAEVFFGELARSHNRTPLYDAGSRRCAETWCHQGYQPDWTRPKAEAASCGTCHGLPPPAPHPQATNCSTCHGDVIDAEGTFFHPERHVDGVVQFSEPACNVCHGDSTSSAPPRDLAGNRDAESVGVGAHRRHVLGTSSSRAVPCSECHRVPGEVEDPDHIDGGAAEVIFSGVARAHGRAPDWRRSGMTCRDSWCHGPGAQEANSSPVWTTDERLACTSCHGAPPPAPHPQMTRCATCHGEVINDAGEIISPERHVDGQVQVEVPSSCNGGCHGATNPAPPVDTRGNLATSAAGVGAHQRHVLGTQTARAVPCDECHSVPSSFDDEGHADTLLPAEVHFSGVATQYDAPTMYSEGRCRDSYCHGAVFYDGRLSGGSNTAPSWTRVDGTEAACGSCHGLPPPPGHPQIADCQSCHLNVRPDNVSFFDPTLHVNGITENYLP